MPNRINYEHEMEATLAHLAEIAERPRLLLHACCAPCSSATLERLSSSFDVTILYYNPNIYPPQEYHRREAELERFVVEAGYASLPHPVKVVELPYRPEEFYQAVKGLEKEPERGARCTVCYRLRLEQAARYAAAHGFFWFTTTLSISPVKDPVRLNEIGCAVARQYGVHYLVSEFRKKDGYKRSLILSAQYGLYRQDYCGCEFSKAARERADAQKLLSSKPVQPV
jgi:predicted adenine nucleotide alpha hydrolase (AANH) superfamily ATPase